MVSNGFTIKVNVKGDVEVKDMLNRYRGKLPQITEDMLQDVKRVYVSEMLNQLSSRHISDTGHLQAYVRRNNVGNIRSESKYKKSTKIEFPEYGALLAYMKPHYVSAMNKQRVQQWIDRKNYRGNPRSILVQPNDWITPAMQRSSMLINMAIKKHLDRLD